MQGEPALAPDLDRLRALVAQIAEFRIRDHAMSSAQKTMEAILTEREPTEDEFRRYLGAVERYFSGFAREARQRLDELDRRITHVNQVQFNLQAERGVALRRVELTQGVLSGVAELAS
ncbi:MAG TPA: hypothetical protein VMD07_02040 [Candidatus Acidoferrales bacterium]|nr:hypothetical protein [Candidatus Acidoferrales bacterium]